MKTDRRSERSKATGPPLSRRAFVAASGAVAGPALVGRADADGGADTDGGADREEGASLTGLDVAATAPYRETVRRSLEGATGRVRLERAFGDRAAILVAGRSVDAVGTLRGVVADATGGLNHRNSEWREPLARPAILERWASDAPVEAWSESPEVVDTETPLGDRATREDASARGTALVRGPRAFQYADGRGGVGYYDVDRAAIDAASRDGDDAVTPLVRLAYVHVDEEAIDGDVATRFLAHYRDSVDTVADVTTQFVDPAIED